MTNDASGTQRTRWGRALRIGLAVSLLGKAGWFS